MDAEIFRKYLKVNNFRYYPSDCFNLTHFDIYVNDTEIELIERFLDTLGKDDEMKYWDTEHSVIVTETELREEFEKLSNCGGTDATTFTEYVRNCTGKNGTLEIIK